MSDSVFEALFRQAVIENFYDELDSLPPRDELAKQYIPSDAHKARMKRLFASEARKERLRATSKLCRRIAAAFVITAAILLGALMSVPQVRASVIQTFVEWYERFVSFTSGSPEASKTNMEPEYVPEGFIEIIRDDLTMMTIIVYANDAEGSMITFQSFRASDAIAVDNENAAFSIQQIDGVEYHLLSADDDTGENTIVWDMDEQRYVITSTISMDELVKIAVSVK